MAYRAVYAIDGDDPLGPEPPQHTRQHQAWSAASTAIQASNSAGPSGAERLGQLLLASEAPTIDDPMEQSRRGPTRTA